MLDDLEARARHYRSVLEDARADQLMKNWVMRLLDDLDKAIKIGQALLIIDKEKVYLRYRRALERIIQRACRHCSAYETAAGAYGISWAKRPDDPIIAMRTGREDGAGISVLDARDGSWGAYVVKDYGNLGIVYVLSGDDTEHFTDDRSIVSAREDDDE